MTVGDTPPKRGVLLYGVSMPALLRPPPAIPPIVHLSTAGGSTWSIKRPCSSPASERTRKRSSSNSSSAAAWLILLVRCSPWVRMPAAKTPAVNRDMAGHPRSFSMAYAKTAAPPTTPFKDWAATSQPAPAGDAMAVPASQAGAGPAGGQSVERPGGRPRGDQRGPAGGVNMAAAARPSLTQGERQAWSSC